jgi:hypothetical protein
VKDSVNEESRQKCSLGREKKKSERKFLVLECGWRWDVTFAKNSGTVTSVLHSAVMMALIYACFPSCGQCRVCSLPYIPT